MKATTVLLQLMGFQNTLKSGNILASSPMGHWLQFEMASNIVGKKYQLTASLSGTGISEHICCELCVKINLLELVHILACVWMQYIYPTLLCSNQSKLVHILYVVATIFPTFPCFFLVSLGFGICLKKSQLQSINQN